MSRLTKLPTTNSTWQKMMDMVSSAGVDSSLLQRNFASGYGSQYTQKVNNVLLIQEHAKLRANRLKSDSFSPAHKPAQISSINSHEVRPEKLEQPDTNSLKSTSIQEQDKKPQGDSESSPEKASDEGLSESPKEVTNLAKQFERLKEKSQSRQKPVDALIGASLKRKCLKSDALSLAQGLFQTVIPEIVARFNQKEPYPHIFQIPFLHKHNVLLLRTASREQAEYLFNKALNYNPVEVQRPPVRSKAGSSAAIIGTLGAISASNAAVVAAVC